MVAAERKSHREFDDFDAECEKTGRGGVPPPAAMSHVIGARGRAPSSYMIGGVAIPARPLAPALHLVATPIGNLGDITLRALETLAAADVLACEDTRVARVLLTRYGISQRPVAYHEHNAAEAGPRLIAALKDGRSVALASDAGTPLVSDPGFRLVEAAIAVGIPVIPVPGASAALAALVASGLPSDAFFFAGFLPAKDGARRTRLESLAAVPGTLIFYESPNRLAASLAAMAHGFGDDRPAAVCRELTKAFEEIRRAPLGELAAHYLDAGQPKGEVVVVVAPPAARSEAGPEETDRLLRTLAAEMPLSKAAAEAARLTGLARAQLYRRLVELKGAGDG
jgi:16S rRNA (cytidine1402-2'-O)-methyltransferase